MEGSIACVEGAAAPVKSHWGHRCFQILMAVSIGILMVMSVDSRNEMETAERRRLLRGLSEEYIFGNNAAPVSIPVFFINLDASSDRRKFVEGELEKRNLKYKRVRAISTAEVVDVRVEVQTMIPPNNHEVACISSHLAAMWEAINDDTVDPTNPYAIIMEDDVALQFDVDFSALINNAPSDFTILQLTTSNSYEVNKMWEDYRLASLTGPELISSALWRRHKVSDGLWSTQAYVIRKAAVKEFVEKAVTIDPNQNRKISLKQAGRAHCQRLPGMPANAPCLQPFRMVADLYLYAAFTPVYTLRVPIFNGASVGKVSLIPTSKNKDSAAAIAFSEIGGIIERVKGNQQLLPSFIKVEPSASEHVAVAVSTVVVTSSATITSDHDVKSLSVNIPRHRRSLARASVN
jgi:GR25 family glycosyltransferase involved in LPS biosynthesis